MTKDERDAIIERCALVIDQCNREGPFQAIAGAKRIRALMDEPHAEQVAAHYPNGAPMFAPDGMMLDENGNRSTFDDVDG